MSGWIKIHRELFDHWISSDAVKFKMWLIMLSEANYSDKKFNLGNTIYHVKMGECAYSLRTWATKFNCGVKSVNSFFDLLESDKMIQRKTIGKGKHSTTLVIITNYTIYQEDKETQGDTQGDTQGKRKGHTTEEVKKNKKERNIDISDFDLFEDFIDSCNLILGKNFKQTKNYRTKFEARIKDGYTQGEILGALENAKKQTYHIETNFKYLTPEFITRPDKIELYKNHE